MLLGKKLGKSRKCACNKVQRHTLSVLLTKNGILPYLIAAI